MRTFIFATLLLCCSLTLVAAWSKEDHEIFRLRDQIEKYEGEGVSFYDFLGLKLSANQDDINKAYRQKSRSLHPDKAKASFIATHEKSQAKKSPSGTRGGNVRKGPSKTEINQHLKNASDRFARLGLITNVLRGPGRARYDHFLSNGFPKWRGSGYYYERFRPGLGSVLLGLFVFAGGAVHYGILYLNWRRHQDFVGRYVKDARKSAWGDDLGIKGIPQFGESSISATPAPSALDDFVPGQNRKQRRLQERESKKYKGGKPAPTDTPATTPSEPMGEKKRVRAENGKVLIVDSIGNVFMEERNDEGELEEYLLDPNQIPRPTFQQTALFTLPIWAYRRTVGAVAMRLRGETEDVAIDEEDDSTESDETSSRATAKADIVNGSRKRASKKAARR